MPFSQILLRYLFPCALAFLLGAPIAWFSAAYLGFSACCFSFSLCIALGVTIGFFAKPLQAPLIAASFALGITLGELCDKYQWHLAHTAPDGSPFDPSIHIAFASILAGITALPAFFIAAARDHDTP